jgi:hypothetical protein
VVALRGAFRVMSEMRAVHAARNKEKENSSSVVLRRCRRWHCSRAGSNFENSSQKQAGNPNRNEKYR